MSRILIAAFYHFTALPDFRALKSAFRKECQAHGIKGTLLLAEEGINGTLAGPEAGLRVFLSWVRSDPRFRNLKHKESWVEDTPFVRLKVRLRQEIVTLGVPDIDPSKSVGRYVRAEQWNDLISQPDVVLIDARNTYETEMGSFKGAIDPRTESFGEFPEWLKGRDDLRPDTRIAMFCTGGIRCEKASAYMLREGFKEVYHLEGGILKYLEAVPVEKSLWNGECYVFDRRVSVDHQLKPGSYDMCCACGHPIAPDEKQSPHYIEGIACLHCFAQTTDAQKAGFAERQKQVELAAARETSHFERQHQPLKDPEVS